MIPFLYAAGIVQILMALSSIPLPRMIPLREDFAKLSPIVRNICTVHYVYIAGTLFAFGLMCLLFADELAARTGLALFLLIFLAIFWTVRTILQFVYYDRATRRQFPVWDAVFTLADATLAATFTLTAIGDLT